MKTVALVSPSSDGHHETYLRLFTQTVVGLGHRAAAFTPKSDRLREWANDSMPNADSTVQAFELDYHQRFHLPGVLSIWSGKIAWVRYIGRMIRASGIYPDLVFHTWLDNCLTPGLTAGMTDLLFPYPWSGIYFHAWYLRRNLSFARLRHGPLANHAALMSRNCPAVAVVDEGIVDRLQHILGNKPVIVFPDFADDSPPDHDYPISGAVRRQANGRKVISLLGVLTKRKGMLMLIDIAQQPTSEGWFFVFAGQYYADSFTPDEQHRIDEFVRSEPANCLFHFGRIPTEAQFNSLVDASDVLFAVYQNFYSSSNLLTKAAIFHKPIVVSNAALMGERVRAFDLGLTIDENSTQQCVNALRALTCQAMGTGELPIPQYDTYARLHSVQQLGKSFKALLHAAGI